MNTAENTVAPFVVPETTAVQPYNGNDVITPMSMIDRAVASGASIETIERLMALHERLVASQAVAAYSNAMCEAQSTMRPISADASNKQTASKYASYHALDRVLRPIYSANGFSISFDGADATANDAILITAIVSHKDGHSKSFKIPMPADGKGAKGGDVMTKTHAMGAAITYGRRYLLGMIFNIAVGDDNDGNARDRLIEGSNTITPDEFIFLRDLIETSKAVEAKVLASVNATSMETMTQKQYREAKSKLEAWIKSEAKNAPAKQ